jgi:polyisoprenoid-binding protein YceI
MLRHLLVALPLCAAFPAKAAKFTLDREHSVFAVVTHRAGIAGALLHEHLIVAQNAQVELEYEKGNLRKALFRLRARAEDLTIDDPSDQKEWYPRLKSLRVVSEPFTPLTGIDLKEIRRTMLGPTQLDAARHPEIGVEVRHLEESAGRFEDVLMTHLAKVAVTIHGRTVERTVGVKITQLAGKRLELEAIGRFRLSEFGIKPYETALGAMKVGDEVHFVVVASAHPSHAG